MLRLPNKLLFAIEAVVDIAYNAGPLPVRSAEVTRRQGIPKRYLEQVLQQLVRAGILEGVRGPRGGYRLARERRRITLGDITRVVQELTAGEEEAEHTGSPLGQAVVRPLWGELTRDFMHRLDDVTVEDLCVRARDSSIPRDGADRLDYTI